MLVASLTNERSIFKLVIGKFFKYVKEVGEVDGVEELGALIGIGLVLLIVLIPWIVFTVVGAIFINKDINKTEQAKNKTGWILGFVLVQFFMWLGSVVLGAYLFMTGRKGWGIFWIALPVVGVILYIGILITMSVFGSLEGY